MSRQGKGIPIMWEGASLAPHLEGSGRGLMQRTHLGAGGPGRAEGSMCTRGLRGLQLQDEILHVWGEKLQSKTKQVTGETRGTEEGRHAGHRPAPQMGGPQLHLT